MKGVEVTSTDAYAILKIKIFDMRNEINTDVIEVIGLYPTAKDVYLSYLPYAHIMETLIFALIMTHGRTFALYSGNPRKLVDLLVESVKLFNENNKPLYQFGMFKIENIKTTDGKVANSSGRNKSSNGKISKINAISVYSVKNQTCEATEFIVRYTSYVTFLSISISLFSSNVSWSNSKL